MLAGGEAVLVAVSGGADSVALLYALQALGAELRLTLSVVHRDPKLLRNRIRHELLPQLAASYNPAIVAALNRAAALTRDLLAHLTAQAARELSGAASVSGDEVTLSQSRLRALPEELAAEVL